MMPWCLGDEAHDAWLRQCAGMFPELARLVNRPERGLEVSAVVQWCRAAYPVGDGVGRAVKAEDATPFIAVRVVLRPSQFTESKGQVELRHA